MSIPQKFGLVMFFRTSLETGSALSRLSIPIFLTRLGGVSMALADSIMLSWWNIGQLGPYAAAAGVQQIFVAIGVNLLVGAEVIGSKIYRHQDGFAFRRLLSICIWLALVGGCLAFAVTVGMSHFYSKIGLPSHFEINVQRAQVAFGWGLPGLYLYIAGAGLLAAIGKPGYALWVTIAANVFNILGNFLALTNEDQTAHAETVAWVTTLTRWTMGAVAVLLCFVSTKKLGEELHSGKVFSFWRPVLGQGLSAAVAQGISASAISGLLFIVATRNASMIAGLQIGLNFLAVFTMGSFAIASATSIMLGHHDGTSTKLSIIINALLLGLVYVGILAMLVGFSPELWGRLHTALPGVIAAVASLLPACLIILLLETILAICIAVLRSGGDIFWPALARAGSFWLVGGTLLVFVVSDEASSFSVYLDLIMASLIGALPLIAMRMIKHIQNIRPIRMASS